MLKAAFKPEPDRNILRPIHSNAVNELFYQQGGQLAVLADAGQTVYYADVLRHLRGALRLLALQLRTRCTAASIVPS